jgi:hypothetical protein
MPLDTLLASLLMLQGVMGGVDTVLNHEYLEGLPKRPEARREIGLHSMRETIYAVLFGGLGWFAWHGALVYAVAALVLGEITVSTIDEWTENRIRVLPQNERVLHVFLTLNMGLIVAILVPTLARWIDQPTELVPADHGWMSWALLALSAAAAAWSARDFIAWRSL